MRVWQEGRGWLGACSGVWQTRLRGQVDFLAGMTVFLFGVGGDGMGCRKLFINHKKMELTGCFEALRLRK
jgi:hypothetical protein